MRNLIKLIIASFLLSVNVTHAASSYPSDAANKQQAFFLATNNVSLNDNKTNKLILMIICDVKSCTACRSLQYGILPHSKIKNFLKESFVYWGSGPDYNSTEFREYSGNGTVPLPTAYVINPFSAPGTYLYSASGADAVGTYFAWLSSAYLKATTPMVLKITTGNNLATIIGKAPSTNITYGVIKYKVNNGAWLSSKVVRNYNSDFQLNNVKLTDDSNTLYIQGVD